MRRWWYAFALVSLVATGACGATLTYVANMTGAQENPTNSSSGVGTATLVIDTIANTASLSVTFSGLASPTAAAHIHCCAAPPANVGVAIGSSGFPGAVTSGSFSTTYNLLDPSIYNGPFVTGNGGTAAGAMSALLAGLAGGQSYYNIHTNNSPGGEIRAFFAVPEPSLAALLAAGALLASWRGFTRRR